MNTLFPHLLRQALVAVSLLGCMASPALAHGGAWRGGHHHHHGARGHWVAPALVGGVLLGAALARPTYAYPVTPAPIYAPPPTFVPPVVTYHVPPVLPPPVGYFCMTSGQFYPYVATCDVPWQLL
jgi:hypothetical protein